MSRDTTYDPALNNVSPFLSAVANLNNATIERVFESPGAPF